ncbi:MAG: Amidohydro-rel protein [Deltaproteobacteria bacterium]|nr:Amidohydro-rel protein [Deltaproteobacteria bacterium]
MEKRPVKPHNPNTRAPRFALPPGACDTHLHIYGPFDRYPLVEERGYDPDPRSTLDDYLNVHRKLGLERAVIVTGSGNGTNNRISLDAIARMEGKFKGVALLDPAIGDAELRQLKEGGCTGFRIKAEGRGGFTYADTERMVARSAGFDWHIEFMPQSLAEVIAAVPFLNSLKVPYLFDHVAHAEPHMTSNDPKLKELLAILKNEERAWINLYSFYQLSEAGPPDYRDMISVVQAIVSNRSDNIVWGSNWPHGGVSVPIPDDGDLLDFLLTAVPEEKTRNAILADNPAKLYGWLS